MVHDIHGAGEHATKPGKKRQKAREAEKAAAASTEATPPTTGAKKRRKRTPLKFGGQRIPKGTKLDIHLKVSEHYTGQPVDVPITVVRGAKAGPRLFLTAAVHGDEINGIRVIREVLDSIEPEELRGTLVACPVVNRFGFVAHMRYMPDRRDLNRCFPGNPEGPTAYRYAHEIFRHVIEPCDYGVDLHTAGYQRHNLPQVRGDMDHDDVRRLAKAFGAEVILDKSGMKGTLRQAATEAGVPTIIYEAGETFRFQRDAVTRGVQGVVNVMRELKMLKGKPLRPDYQIITKSSAWIRSDHGGIVETFIDAGTLVHEGEAIAAVSDPFGKESGIVRAPFTGLVVGVTTLPMVNPGAPICHLVKLRKTLETVLAHHGAESVSLEEAPLHLAHMHPEEVEGSAGTPEEDETEG